jgi:hypothetical protein
LRSASSSVARNSIPSTRWVTVLPFGSSTLPASGLAAYPFATATTSPAKLGVAARQSVSVQKVLSVLGMARSTSAL